MRVCSKEQAVLNSMIPLGAQDRDLALLLMKEMERKPEGCFTFPVGRDWLWEEL